MMYLLGDQINCTAELWKIIVKSWAQQKRGKAVLGGGLHILDYKQQITTNISTVQNIVVYWIRYNFFFCPSKPSFQIASLNQS